LWMFVAVISQDIMAQNKHVPSMSFLAEYYKWLLEIPSFDISAGIDAEICNLRILQQSTIINNQPLLHHTQSSLCKSTGPS
jgi:hypothetical protein